MFEDFIKRFREVANQAEQKAADAAKNVTFSSSSTDIPSDKKRYIEKAPTLVDENGHQKAWGFEEDKRRYADVTDLTNPKVMNSFTWRDYTVTPKNDERKSVNFSVAYDKDGSIAGIMKKDEGEPDGNGMVYPTAFGRDKIKKFFSQFDRDATSYRVWQNEGGDGYGQAEIIFDSDEDDAPFIPSTIFKNREIPKRRSPMSPIDPNSITPPYDMPIAPLNVDTPQVQFTSSQNFLKNFRNRA